MDTVYSWWNCLYRGPLLTLTGKCFKCTYLNAYWLLSHLTWQVMSLVDIVRIWITHKWTFGNDHNCHHPGSLSNSISIKFTQSIPVIYSLPHKLPFIMDYKDASSSVPFLSSSFPSVGVMPECINVNVLSRLRVPSTIHTVAQRSWKQRGGID